MSRQIIKAPTVKQWGPGPEQAAAYLARLPLPSESEQVAPFDSMEGVYRYKPTEFQIKELGWNWRLLFRYNKSQILILRCAERRTVYSNLAELHDDMIKAAKAHLAKKQSQS